MLVLHPFVAPKDHGPLTLLIKEHFTTNMKQLACKLDFEPYVNNFEDTTDDLTQSIRDRQMMAVIKHMLASKNDSEEVMTFV